MKHAEKFELHCAKADLVIPSMIQDQEYARQKISGLLNEDLEAVRLEGADRMEGVPECIFLKYTVVRRSDHKWSTFNMAGLVEYRPVYVEDPDSDEPYGPLS